MGCGRGGGIDWRMSGGTSGGISVGCGGRRDATLGNGWPGTMWCGVSGGRGLWSPMEIEGKSGVSAGMEGVTLWHGTLGTCGALTINVGCTLGMVALGSNREGCGTAVVCRWRRVAGVGKALVVERCGVSVVVATEKILESCWMALIWSSPRVSNGEAGAG